jgi:hypothetical protein
MMRSDPADGDVSEAGQGRSRGLELVQEPGNCFSITLGIDQDTMLPVAHRTAEPMGYGQPVNKWAKAYPLDNPFDHDAATGLVSRLGDCE